MIWPSPERLANAATLKPWCGARIANRLLVPEAEYRGAGGAHARGAQDVGGTVEVEAQRRDEIAGERMDEFGRRAVAHQTLDSIVGGLMPAFDDQRLSGQTAFAAQPFAQACLTAQGP